MSVQLGPFDTRHSWKQISQVPWNLLPIKDPILCHCHTRRHKVSPAPVVNHYCWRWGDVMATAAPRGPKGVPQASEWCNHRSLAGQAFWVGQKGILGQGEGKNCGWGQGQLHACLVPLKWEKWVSIPFLCRTSCGCMAAAECCGSSQVVGQLRIGLSVCKIVKYEFFLLWVPGMDN